ncbi:MAG: hypothetical protein V1702_05260 [Candidatus Woesearchaeota archaeon]
MQVTQKYWSSQENIRKNLDWLIAKEGIPFEELPRRISYDLLKCNGMGSLRTHYRSLFKILDTAYPGKFRTWQLRHNGQRIWTRNDGTPDYEICRQATRWLAEKMGLDAFDSGTITIADFGRYGLQGMLHVVYGASPRKAVDDAYPGVIKRGSKLPQRFWKSEKGLEAAVRAIHRLVIREGIPIDEIPQRLQFDLLRKGKLSQIVDAVPSHSHIDLIIAAYPRFEPSDFPSYRGQVLHSGNATGLEKKLARYRVREDGSVIDLGSEEGRDISLKVTRELLETEGLSVEEAPTKLSKGLFKKHHLLQVFEALGNNIYSVVKALLPEKEIKPWEVKKAPQGYWKGPEGLEHAAQATRWLIEDVLRTPVGEIPEKVHQKTFVEYGLCGMMHLFNGNVYMAVDNAYPGRFREWDIRHKDMWQGEAGKSLGKKAVRWLAEYLQIPVNDVPTKLKTRHFRENHLGGCLENCFGSSLYTAVSETFPEIPNEEIRWMLKRRNNRFKDKA